MLIIVKLCAWLVKCRLVGMVIFKKWAQDCAENLRCSARAGLRVGEIALLLLCSIPLSSVPEPCGEQLEWQLQVSELYTWKAVVKLPIGRDHHVTVSLIGTPANERVITWYGGQSQPIGAQCQAVPLSPRPARHVLCQAELSVPVAQAVLSLNLAKTRTVLQSGQIVRHETDGSMGLPLCLSLLNIFIKRCNSTHYLLGWDQGEDQQCNEAGWEDGLRCDHARGRRGGLWVRQRGHHHARGGQGGAGRPEAEDEGEEVYGVADAETRQGPQWSLQHHVVTRRAYEGIERYLWI